MNQQLDTHKAKNKAKLGRKDKEKTLESLEFQGFSLVDDTRLELVTSRTSSGCATSCANRPYSFVGKGYSSKGQ